MVIQTISYCLSVCLSVYLHFVLQAVVCTHLEAVLDGVNWVIGKAKMSYASPEGTCTIISARGQQLVKLYLLGD